MEKLNQFLFKQGQKFLSNPNQPYHALGWLMIRASNY